MGCSLKWPIKNVENVIAFQLKNHSFFAPKLYSGFQSSGDLKHRAIFARFRLQIGFIIPRLLNKTFAETLQKYRSNMTKTFPPTLPPDSL